MKNPINQFRLLNSSIPFIGVNLSIKHYTYQINMLLKKIAVSQPTKKSLFIWQRGQFSKPKPADPYLLGFFFLNAILQI